MLKKKDVFFYTFEKVALQWKEKKSKEVKPKSLKASWIIIEKHLLVQFGNTQISKITPSKVLKELIEPSRNSFSEKNIELFISKLNDVLTFGVNAGLIPQNPCKDLKKISVKTKTTHNPTIKPDDLPIFLNKLRNSKIKFNTKLLILFQLFTGVRPNEASNAKWSEIDFEKKLWVIPANRMKGKHEHIVPLSTQ